MPDLFIKAQAGESLESFAYRTAKLLSLQVLERGDSVVRIENAWSKDRAKKIFYAHNPAAPQLSTEKVVTTKG